MVISMAQKQTDMKTRRDFFKTAGGLALGALVIPSVTKGEKVKNIGIQLYSVRKEMLADAVGALKQLAKIGYKELESARSEKGNYYGFQPKEIKKIVSDLGMTLRSGHVHLDKDWQRSIDGASEAGQDYLICSSLPSKGQTVDNYKKVAETSRKLGKIAKNQISSSGITTTNMSLKRKMVRCYTIFYFPAQTLNSSPGSWISVG
jgi:hypothetical protein